MINLSPIDAGFVLSMVGLCGLLLAALLITTGEHAAGESRRRAGIFFAACGLAALGFWAFGYALSQPRAVGGAHVFPTLFVDAELTASFLPQLFLQCAGVGLVIALLADRMSNPGLVIAALLFGTIVHPLLVNQAWTPSGILKTLGFVDHAGAAVLIAAAGLFVVGARWSVRLNWIVGETRYGPLRAPGLVLLLSLYLLAILLAPGKSSWSLVITPSSTLANSVLALLSAGLVAAGWSAFLANGFKWSTVANAGLAGLVAIAAVGGAASPLGALVLGLLAALVMLGSANGLRRLGLQESTGLLQVLLAGGIAGTLALPLAVPFSRFSVANSLPGALANQALGLLLLGICSLGLAAIGIGLLARFKDLEFEAELANLPIDPSPLLRQVDRFITADNTGYRFDVETDPELFQLSSRLNRLLDRLEFKLVRNKAIVDTFSVGIITFSPARRRILSVNPAAETMFGASEKELIDQPMSTVLTLSEGGLVTPEELESHLSARVNTRVSSEMFGRGADGEWFPVEVTVNEAEIAGRELFYTATIRNTTEQKRREIELQKHREQLNDLITSQTQMLSEARDQAQEASLAKSMFLANMSHELRTPMNAIIGYSEMMIEDADEDGHIHLVPDLERVIDAGKHLLNLISDILDLSKIEVGKMELCVEVFELAPLIEEVKSTVGPLLAKNSNRFECHVGKDVGSMRSDPTKVRQVLFNLLSNACKFTEKGEVGLEVVSHRRNQRRFIRFRVRDSGIGMSAEQIAMVFAEFIQGDASTTRRFGGTGLGLTLCQKFCRLMGGDIRVESEPGRGSMFSVDLPAEVSQTPAAADQSNLPEADSTTIPAARMVLAIDNDAPARDWLQSNLSNHGFRVVTAWSAQEGLRLAKILQPAVITFDPLMNDLDGWSFLDSLRSDPALKSTPTILLPLSENLRRGYLLSTEQLLYKPLSDDALETLTPKADGQIPTRRMVVLTDDDVLIGQLRSSLDPKRWAVEPVLNVADAERALSKPKTGLVMLDLTASLEGFRLLTRIYDHPQWRTFTLRCLIADKLNRVDRLRFQRNIMKLLKLGANRRERLITEILDCVSRLADTHRAEARRPGQSGLLPIPGKRQ